MEKSSTDPFRNSSSPPGAAATRVQPGCLAVSEAMKTSSVKTSSTSAAIWRLSSNKPRSTTSTDSANVAWFGFSGNEGAEDDESRQAACQFQGIVNSFQSLTKHNPAQVILAKMLQ